MELIEGETWKNESAVRVVRRADDNRDRAQVANALLAAETCGLVHRDIKPGNLMMIDGGDETDFTIKVIDFGVPKRSPQRPTRAN